MYIWHDFMVGPCFGPLKPKIVLTSDVAPGRWIGPLGDRLIREVPRTCGARRCLGTTKCLHCNVAWRLIGYAKR